MKKFIIASMVLVAAVLLGTSSARAQITGDDFNRLDGELSSVSAGLWSVYSGTTGALSNFNNQALIRGNGTLDEQISITGTHNNDKLFAGFDVNVASWPLNSGNGYFALFKDSGTFNFYGRVSATNLNNGTVKFGIANSGGSYVYSSAVAVGTTVRLVLQLDQTGANNAPGAVVASLSVDNSPFIVANDPVTSWDGVGFNTLNAHISVVGFGLRQSNTTTMGNLTVDNLLIGTSLADVVPEPSTVLLVGAGMLGLLAMRRRRS